MAVRDRKILGKQDFDFVQILPKFWVIIQNILSKFCSNLSKFYSNPPKFCPKKLAKRCGRIPSSYGTE